MALYRAEPTLVLSAIALDPNNALSLQVILRNPFGKVLASNTLAITPASPNSKLYPCSPCQLHNRARCARYNSICWVDYMAYNEPYTMLTTEDCYIAIASECYKVWKANGTTDRQCEGFTSQMDFMKMQIRPSVLSAAYYIEDKLKLLVTFNTPVRTSSLLACDNIFSDSTLKWLLPGTHERAI